MDKRLLLGLLFILLPGCATDIAGAGSIDARSTSPNSQNVLENYFDGIRDDPVALRTFLLRFPKGADLHSHLSGAVYAESYLKWALDADLCVYVEIYYLNNCPRADAIAAPFNTYTQARLKDYLALYPDYRYRLIDAFSMRNFVQDHDAPSSADQFFATFDKFGAAGDGRDAAMLAEVLNRAGAQNVAYVEIMMTPDGGTFLGMGAGLDWSDNLPAMEASLLRQGFRDKVAAAGAGLSADIRDARRLMGCGTADPAPGCGVEIRLLAQALRNLDNTGSVFALIMACFYVAGSNDDVVGVNFVMREDGEYSLRDYAEHMKIMKYFTGKFPGVNLSLHAGELTLGLVPPEDLKNHIELAVASGARRIGHGVDIGYEEHAPQTLKKMADAGILVEINLTSNQSILGVSKPDHPFPLYRAAGVPVALSTDDEGVLRNDLTHEYVRATLDYDLSYADLKQLSRNALAYSFLPDADKARLLMKLEQAFADFEADPPLMTH